MRFVQEIRTSTSGNQSEKIKLAANQWKNLSEDGKQIYYHGYKKALVGARELRIVSINVKSK